MTTIIICAMCITAMLALVLCALADIYKTLVRIADALERERNK